MKRFLTAFFTVLLLIWLSLTSAAQQTLSSITSRVETPFVSDEDKFAIQLPPPSAKFVWKFKEGEIRLAFTEIGYNRNFLDREDFEHTVWGFERNTLDKIPGRTDEKRSENDFKSNTATRFYNFDDGKFGAQKFLLIDKRFYTMLAVFDNKENEKHFRRVFETFKITGKIDFDALFRKRLEALTPAALPQKSPFSSEKNDLTDENLKGKVRKIVESVTVSQNSESKKRAVTKFFEYDRRGYLLREVSLGLNGMPATVTVYGFMDGKRVSRFGFDLGSDRLFEPPEFEPNEIKSGTKFVNNSGYTSAYVKKHENGKLTEQLYYDRSGKISYRRTFQYKKNQVEIHGYDSNGNAAMKTLSTFNKNGDISEVITYNAELVDGYTKEIFEYEYDKAGNWIKQTRSLERRDYGENVFIPQFSVFRTITYF